MYILTKADLKCETLKNCQVKCNKVSSLAQTTNFKHRSLSEIQVIGLSVQLLQMYGSVLPDNIL